MLTGAKQNRNAVFTTMVIMVCLIVGGFLMFAESDAQPEMVELVDTLDIATVAEPKQVVLPESVHVPILVYHHVRPIPSGLSASDRTYNVSVEAFESHLKYLQENGFTSVLLTDIRDALLEGKQLPDKPVAITFDDGRDNQYAYVFPLLQKHDFVATFSPFTNAIGRPGYMTWDQLVELRDAGNDIGSHAVYHPFMTKLGEEEMRREAGDSRELLREKLGTEVAVFSHPFGLYNDETNAVLFELGYTIARGLEHTADHTAEDLMSLGAYIATDNLGNIKNIVGE